LGPADKKTVSRRRIKKAGSQDPAFFMNGGQCPPYMIMPFLVFGFSFFVKTFHLQYVEESLALGEISQAVIPKDPLPGTLTKNQKRKTKNRF